MADFSDDELLRLNDRTGVIPPERIDAARRRQQIEGGATLRNLASILREEGFLTDTREEVLRQGAPGRPGDPTKRLESRPVSSRRPPDVEGATRQGRRLGPFLLVQEVGRGGMGRVWRAWDEQVGRYVALKVLEGGDPDARERFVREAQIAGRLAHANIAAVYQAGEDDSRGWIAMQFVDGAAVDAVPLPIPTALERVRDAARALAHAHDQGVVHRDVKPGNILVDKSGRVFLTDFGLAKESASEGGAPMSITGAVLGTPQYMAPEQARGDRKSVGPLSDVYSLGVTLYTLLAGRPPFQGTDVAALLVAVAQQAPPPLRRANPRISPELEDVVARAMEKRADRRWPSAAAFADALDRLLREKRYEGRYGLARSLTRRWLPWAVGAVFLGLSLRVALPVLLAPPPLPTSVPGDVAQELLREAAFALGVLEERGPQERASGVAQQVLPRIDRALAARPGVRRAQVLRARALVAAGRTSEAAAALAELEGGDDYRVPYLKALLGLERALATPPPLPAVESPVFAWATTPRPPPGDWGTEIAKATTVPPDLKADWARDEVAVTGLQALTAGDWGKAESRLRKPAESPIVPALRRAWERAAYLARRFEALGPGAAVRERVGAGLATAVTASDLERLRTATGGDADARVALEVALARRRMDEGA
ncbi:MAG TPA: serine/threonine-protein kinase, partial [Planctomycetota bacterium]|nr:serine/threonine-protein kinase [Planctomycetota bacterium]